MESQRQKYLQESENYFNKTQEENNNNSLKFFKDDVGA